MSTEENKQTARRLIEDPWKTGNLDLLDEVCAPSYHNKNLGGLVELKQALAEIKIGFPDARQTVEEMVAEDDKVVARVAWRGTHTGVYQGIAPTGKIVTGQGATFYRFVDGKVVDDLLISEGPDILQYLRD